MNALQVAHVYENSLAPEIGSIHFGETGCTCSDRIEFEGYLGADYRVAIAVKDPLFFSSRFVQKRIYDQHSGITKSVWINKNSLLKRLSYHPHGIAFLQKNFPELHNEINQNKRYN